MIKKYRILCVFLNPNSVDKYSFTVVDIAKNVITNEIMKLVIGKNMHKKTLSYSEVKTLILRLKSSTKPYDHVISNIEGITATAKIISLVIPASEVNKLVSQYVTNFTKFTMNGGTLQNIQAGEGLYLHQTESGNTSYAIDTSVMEMSTYAILFSVDMVFKNKTEQMLRELSCL